MIRRYLAGKTDPHQMAEMGLFGATIGGRNTAARDYAKIVMQISSHWMSLG
jgi:hypothetical protein